MNKPTVFPHYDIHGDRGPYLLLVHGMLSGRSQWDLNLGGLMAFCRPVVLELYGHGRSPSPDEIDQYLPETYLRVFEDIRESLGVEDWFVCGQSFGATLTFRYVYNHPERVRGHIFTNSISAFGGVDNSPENRKRIHEDADRLASMGREALEKMSIHPRHARRLPAAANKALLEDADLLNAKGVAHTMRHVADVAATSYLAEIGTPNLLVYGVYEKAFSAGAEIAQRELQDLTLVRADAGHAVNIQAADVFNQAVAEFIERLR